MFIAAPLLLFGDLKMNPVPNSRNKAPIGNCFEAATCGVVLMVNPLFLLAVLVAWWPGGLVLVAWCWHV